MIYFLSCVKGVLRVEGVSPSNRGQDARDTLKPVVRLGIKGWMSDGWYPLSEIEIIEEEQLK